MFQSYLDTLYTDTYYVCTDISLYFKRKLDRYSYFELKCVSKFYSGLFLLPLESRIKKERKKKVLTLKREYPKYLYFKCKIIIAINKKYSMDLNR